MSREYARFDYEHENYIMIDVEMEIAREVQPPTEIDPEDVELEKLSELKAE